jgi:hypothetical protein
MQPKLRGQLGQIIQMLEGVSTSIVQLNQSQQSLAQMIKELTVTPLAKAADESVFISANELDFDDIKVAVVERDIAITPQHDSAQQNNQHYQEVYTDATVVAELDMTVSGHFDVKTDEQEPGQVIVAQDQPQTLMSSDVQISTTAITHEVQSC